MVKILAILLLGAITASCTPVMDPGHWDPTVYCATVRPPDPSCAATWH